MPSKEVIQATIKPKEVLDLTVDVRCLKHTHPLKVRIPTPDEVAKFFRYYIRTKKLNPRIGMILALAYTWPAMWTELRVEIESSRSKANNTIKAVEKEMREISDQKKELRKLKAEEMCEMLGKGC